MMIRELTYSQCRAMIAGQRLARLACAENGIPYVVPISYACSGNQLYAFSMPGKKLDMLHANPRACLLVEAFESKHHWRSVVIDGAFRELPDTDEFHHERLKAWSLLADDFDWWEPGALKPQPQTTVATSPHVFFEIDIIEMSGREASEDAG